MTFISGPEYTEIVFSLTPFVSVEKTLFGSSNVLVLFLPWYTYVFNKCTSHYASGTILKT